MTDEITVTTTPNVPEASSFGPLFKQTRSKKRLSSKDVAQQLRLPESIILDLEKEQFPDHIPTTFLRGYIRAYGKFLQIADEQIQTILAGIQHKPSDKPIICYSTRNLDPITSDYYFMQFFSYAIVFSIVGLIGIWGYGHYYHTTKSSQNLAAQAKIPTTLAAIIPTSDNKQQLVKEVKPAPQKEIEKPKKVSHKIDADEDLYDNEFFEQD